MEFDEKKIKPSSNRELLYQQVEEQSGICDVTIQVGQWKKKFHWCVLVMSPFFECIERSDFIEKQTGIVKLDVATPLTTEIAILFLYGKKPKLTEENVEAVLKLSEFLLIPNLKSACVAFLKNISITEENCMKILDISSLYEFEFSQCDDYIRGHLQQILRRKEAMFLTKESVLTLLTDPILAYVSGEEKFEFAIWWAKASQQNRDAFRDIFDVIDLETIDGDFLETVVIQHPLVIELKFDRSNIFSRSTTQDHRVLICPGSNTDNRIACFDLESERWCGIETGLPDDSDLDYTIRNASIVGSCRSREVYRVAKRYNSCKICFQNLYSKEYIIRTISEQENSDSRIEISTYCISKETFVAVSNERKEIISKSKSMPISSLSPLELMRLEMLGQTYDDLSARLLLAKYIERTRHQSRYEDTATIYCGQLQNQDINIYPMLTMRKTNVDSVCMNANNMVGILSKKNDKLHIYDINDCNLDTIPLDEHFGSDDRYSGIQLAAKENGFILYNKETVLTISRLCGPDLTERYSMKKTKLEHDQTWDRNIYIYSNKMWFRLLRKKWNEEFEFSCIDHDALMDTTVEEVEWNRLPSPPKGACTREVNNAFMMELTKSMLRCHFDCPHCSQRKQEQMEQRRSSHTRIVSLAEAADFFFADTDDDSSDGYNYYDDYYDDGDYYYYSSD